MPSVSLTSSADMLNATRPKFLSERKANMLGRDTPFLSDLRANKSPIDGGDRLVIPMDMFNHSAPTRLTNGFDQIDLTFQGVGLPMILDWADIVQPIGISGNEARRNGGTEKVVDLGKQRQENVMNHFDRQLELATLGSTSAPLAFTDIMGFNGDAASDGFLEGVAAASQDNSIGGVSKATYNDRPGMTNQFFDASSDFDANGLDGLYYLLMKTRKIGTKQANLPALKQSWYFSEAAYRNYKKKLQVNERYTTELDGGKTAEVFGGRPIKLLYEGVPTNWSAALIDWSSFEYAICGGRDMELSKWVSLESSGIEAMVAYVGWMGQIIPRYFGTSGVMINGDTY